MDITAKSTHTKLHLAQNHSVLTKIVGIKYKTFQNENGGGSGGGCDCEGYTNEEIREYIGGILNEGN